MSNITSNITAYKKNLERNSNLMESHNAESAY